MGYANGSNTEIYSKGTDVTNELPMATKQNGLKNSHANGVAEVKPPFSLEKSETILTNSSKSSPKGFYMLSNLDQTFPYPIEIIFKFETTNNLNIDVVEVLKTSLEKVLEDFYPFAGWLEVSWDGRMMVDCNGGSDGVPFVEAFSDEEMSVAIGGITSIDDKLVSLMYSGEKPYETILDVPPLSVQVTRFKCGGIILGVGFNHVLVDGRAFADFMNIWCETAKGLPISTKPHLDRSIFFANQSPKIQRSHHEYSKSKSPLIPVLGQKETLLSKSFIFTPSKLSQLKEFVMQKNNEPTSFEILSAVVWICWTKALQISPKKYTQIITAVDGRPKFTQPLPKPYFGNGIVWSSARTKAGEITKGPFSLAVDIVHKAIKEVTENYVKSAIDYHEVMRKPLEQENTLWITKWSRLPFYEVDFSWGKPAQVAPASLVDNLVVVLSEGKDSENLVMSLSLPSEAMKLFEEAMDSYMN